ncbi:MAG: lactate racemase domain-containing protein [Candidatus Kariarchaeaceae archaeon]
MLIDEINLPVNSTIYEPKIGGLNELSSDKLTDKILNSSIPKKIIENPTLAIINDAHRATPSNKILSILLSKVQDHKIEKIIIATGTHEAPSEDELKKLLPKNNYLNNIEIVVHDCKSTNLVHLGETSRGTKILINPIIKEFKQILCINSVEPHYFAGFTGGVKSVLPGLAGIDTVEKNHSWALDPETGPTKIETNPLQLDLKEALTYVDNDILGIQMISIGSQVYEAYSRDLMEAFDQARKRALELFRIRLEKPVDVVLSVVYPPLNRSLYQAQKGIENTRQILKEGGDMILLADCPEGVGNTAFYDTMLKYDSPNDIVNNLTREKYNFGDHKAVKFSTMRLKSNLFIVGNLTNRESKNVFAEKMEINYLQEYLRNASDIGKQIAVVLDSGILVMTL